ncbi:restriction system protein [Variovorax sp. OV329]|nr:restriction system protein [Variovorax sp. OV329]
MLPWWGGVVLALVAYLILHRWAQPVTTAFHPGSVATTAVRSAGASLAGYAQYIVPVLCLVGAGMSAWRRRTRQALVGSVTQAETASALDGMSWRQFELLVGEAFRLQGFRVLEAGGGGPDGGVDLVLIKGGEKFFVQCKQWKAYKVGVDVVRELYGVMAARGATGGFVVTSGTFSGDARDFARGRNLHLIDGAKLFGLLIKAKTSIGARPEPAAAAHRESQWAPAPGLQCPSCGAEMVKRTAKQGRNVGQTFWGCSTYPACKGIRKLV